jgi:hypothetical protein
MDQKFVHELVRAAGPDRAMSADEFATLVPQSMTLEQTAQLIAELENAGITVDIDPKLTRPNDKAGAAPYTRDTLVPPRNETWPRPQTHALQRANKPREPTKQTTSAVWPWIAAVFLLLCALAAAMIWLFT